jgi:hypothetical protein
MAASNNEAGTRDAYDAYGLFSGALGEKAVWKKGPIREPRRRLPLFTDCREGGFPETQESQALAEDSLPRPVRWVYAPFSPSSWVISRMVTHPRDSALLTASPREWTAIFS